MGHGREGLRRKVNIVTSPQAYKPAQVMSKPDIQRSENTTQPQATLATKHQIEHIPGVQTTSGQQSKPEMLPKKFCHTLIQ